MTDDKLEQRKVALEKKTKLCHMVAWPSLILGVALLLSNKPYSMASAMVFFFVGISARVYFYLLRSERRSLRRIEEEMRKHAKIIVFVAAVFATALPPLSARALSAGTKAAPVAGLEWLGDGDVRIFADDGSKIDNKIWLVVFWGTWDKNSPLIFSRLSDIRANYPENKLGIVAVTTDNKTAAENFVAAQPENTVTFNVAVDSDRKVAKAYMGEGVGVPLVFIIGEDGNILWSGPPAFTETILRKIFSGKFDPKTQAEISELQEKLREFLQLEDIQQIIRYSEKILALDPSDEMATRIRIYAFERSGKLPDALAFMDDIVKKAPSTAGPYLVRLDLMNRLGAAMEKRHAAAKEILTRFHDDPETLTRLALLALDRSPFGTAPLDTAAEAAARALELLTAKESPPSMMLAAALTANARALHEIGDADAAVENQRKAVELLQGRAGGKQAKTILDYYEMAKRLRDAKR